MGSALPEERFEAPGADRDGVAIGAAVPAAAEGGAVNVRGENQAGSAPAMASLAPTGLRICRSGREVGMQKRFCACGRAVYVRYGWTGAVWTPEFIFSARDNGARLAHCPACGRSLEIDSLR
jgi:hypothetical protein